MSSVIVRIGQYLPSRLRVVKDCPKSNRTDNPSSNANCVFFLPYRINPDAHWLEFVLGHAFRLRGYRTVLGIGEDAIRYTDGYFCTRMRLPSRIRSMLRAGQLATAFNSELCLFSALLGRHVLANLRQEAWEVPVNDIAQYEKYGVVIGPHIMGSLSRYFLRCEVDLQSNATIAREFLFTGLVSLEAARRVIDRYAPKLLVASHGIYASWGVFCDYFAARGIPFVTWGKQYMRDAFLFSHNKSYHRDIIEEQGEAWRCYSIGEAERSVVIEYVREKASLQNRSDAVNYYRGSSRQSGKLRSRIGSDERIVFGMFPNVSWDAQISFRPLFYRTMNEWIVETIRWFVRHPDRILVVRPHPAESNGHVETVEKVTDVIVRNFPNLPSNVIVFPANDEITSYEVLDAVHVCLVYGSKFGLEAALHGKPLIIAGEAYFRDKGMSYDPTSEEEYFALLERATEGTPVTEEMIENAIAFGYHYYFRRQMILPLAEASGSQFVRYKFDALDQLAPGHIEQLDDLIDRILNGRPFVNPNCC